NLGLVLQALGEADGAISAFQKSISLDPAEPAAYLNLAKLYTRIGSEGRARSLLRSYLGREPGHPGARKLLNQLDE
ncbi:MAG: tetratricopeptide repeat protein, partial [Planctomycetes bacterium]|nr:tetratricopeptide repeat protein [Planctomycetota bacterium]